MLVWCVQRGMTQARAIMVNALSLTVANPNPRSSTAAESYFILGRLVTEAGAEVVLALHLPGPFTH